jgi:hypothetical protein
MHDSKSAFQPHVEKIREVCVRYGIVVRWVRNEGCYRVVRQWVFCRRGTLNVPRRQMGLCDSSADTRDPIESSLEVPAPVSKRTNLGKIPDNSQCLPAVGMV